MVVLQKWRRFCKVGLYSERIKKFGNYSDILEALPNGDQSENIISRGIYKELKWRFAWSGFFERTLQDLPTTLAHPEGFEPPTLGVWYIDRALLMGYQYVSNYSQPNRACDFHRTRLSSVHDM